jgi:hypothetical protein
MNAKEISAYAGHGDVRQTWNRYGHLMPGGEREAGARLDAFLERFSPDFPTEVAENEETLAVRGFRSTATGIRTARPDPLYRRIAVSIAVRGS